VVAYTKADVRTVLLPWELMVERAGIATLSGASRKGDGVIAERKQK